MYQGEPLQLNFSHPIRAQNAGLFVSRGNALHPTRIISSHELIFVKQGIFELFEDDQDFQLEAGSTLHLWPGKKHGGLTPMLPDLRFYWIHFEVSVPSANGEHGWIDQAISSIKIPQFIKLSQPETLERLFRIFLEEQETGHLTPHAANLLIMLMLVEIAQSSEREANTPTVANTVAIQAHNYIRMNFDRPITTSVIAEVLGYNQDYLGRIYHHIYGCTLTEAIHRRRIHIACRYLVEDQLAIDEVALKCGYSDPDYFRRVFRRYMQASPSNYRKAHSRIHINTH
jgi:AraC-like DNA-binding protein